MSKAKTDSIFMVGWEYPPHNSGGLGVACQGITEALAERQHQVYFTLPYQLSTQPGHMKVLSCRDPSWQVDSHMLPFFSYNSKESLQLRSSKKAVGVHEFSHLPQSQMEYQVYQYADQVVNQAYSVNDFEVIHAHDWVSFPGAIKLKQESKKPMIAHVHSTEFDRVPSGYGSSFIMDSEYRGMMEADVVIAVSYYTKRLLVSKYGIPEDKIRVVHNGMQFSPSIDPGKHHFAQGQPVVVFMGRLTDQKGPAYFISLAHQVLKKVPSALFIVAGSGDMYHQLLLKTAGEGLTAKVLFSGFVRHKEREMLLDRADVFVMPSLSEPFGLVALEAAERHTPVIVSKNAGVSEVLPSAQAIDFWDIDKMSQTIATILQDEGYAHQLATQHQTETKQVTWSSAAEKLERIYRSAFVGK